MPWTKLHEFITYSELNDKVLKYINEDKYCDDEYWTLTPLHLSIMANNNTARVALLRKGVKETIFDYHLFETFALWSQRLLSVSRLWDKDSYDAILLQEIRNSVVDDTDNMNPFHAITVLKSQYMKWAYRKPLSQMKFTPYELALAVGCNTDGLSKSTSIKSEWTYESIICEENIRREAMSYLAIAVFKTPEMRKQHLNYVFDEKYTSKCIVESKLKWIAGQLRKEILVPEQFLTMNSYSEWLDVVQSLNNEIQEIVKFGDNTICFKNIIIGTGTEGIVLMGYSNTGRVAIKLTKDFINEKVLYETAYPDKIESGEVSFLPKLIFNGIEYNGAIVMPCYEIGSLKLFLSYIRTKEKEFFTPELRLRMVLDIAKALRDLHAKNIEHNDIKSDNILLQPQLSPIFIDFGLSTIGIRDGFCGTAEYLAPEIWTDGEKIRFKCDVYAFGILMWEVMTGLVLYSCGDEVVEELQIPEKRKQGEVLLSELVPDGTRPTIRDTVIPKEIYERCWEKEPRSRPSMDEVVEILSVIRL